MRLTNHVRLQLQSKPLQTFDSSRRLRSDASLENQLSDFQKRYVRTVENSAFVIFVENSELVFYLSIFVCNIVQVVNPATKLKRWYKINLSWNKIISVQ